MKKSILSIVGILALAAGANAQVIYEGFAYATGALSNGTGGANGGFSAGWTSGANGPTVISGSLTPSATMRTGYATTGNAVQSFTGNGSNVDWVSTRAMSTSISLDSSSTTYFSFLVLGDWTTLGNSRGFNVGFTSSATALSTNAVTIKKDFNTTNLIGAVGGNNIGGNFTGALSDNTVSFVVGKLVTSNSGNETLSFTAYRSGLTGYTSVNATETWAISNVDLGSLTGSLTHFAFTGRVNDNSMVYRFDEFRTGATWDAVTIPEPTTWALLAGGMAALVIYRRRRGV